MGNAARFYHRTRSATCLLALMAFYGGAALAAPAADSNNGGLQEIVVTAEKRTSTVQATPISITALTGEQLQAQGTVDLESVVREVPGISMRSAGPGQTELEMRGLASSGGSAPTVGYYLNEVPLSPPAASLNGKVVIDPDLFDLDHVEVLRGPQGTLYGSGSMGGTIKMTTTAPDLNKFGGTIEGLMSGTPSSGGLNSGGNAMVNVPIVNDKLAVRLVATDMFTAGWIDRITLGNFPLESGNSCGWAGYGCVRGTLSGLPVQSEQKNANWERLEGGRVDVLFKPSDNLTIDTLIMSQRITMGGYSEYDQNPGIVGGVEAHYQPYDMAEPMSDVFRLAANTIKYDFGLAELTAATSYWTREEKQTMDDSEQIQNEMGNGFYVPIGYTEADRSRQFSEEVRFASVGDNRFDWVFGGFYSDLHSLYVAYNQNPALAYLSGGGAAANPGGIIFGANTPYHVQQFAAFGEASYKITDEVKATVGLRWFKYNSSEEIFENGWGGGPYANAIPLQLDEFSTSSGVTPRFNLSYEPNKDLTVYGTISEGFRPGGVNLPGPTSLCGAQPVTYNPDNVWDYEVGEKAKFFDDRLSVNGDLYYLQWNGVQQLILQSCGYPITENAGTAASYGPELEVAAKLIDGLTLNASGTYTDATITSPNAGTGIEKGAPVLNIPKYTGTISLQYMQPVLNDAYLMSARISSSYVGPVYDIAFTEQRLTPYDLVDLRLGLSDDVKSAYFFVNNITDRHAPITINNTSFSWVTPSLTRVATNQPRTIGVDLTYHF
jgi:outer membrane receptor protein involved in Fe transport